MYEIPSGFAASRFVGRTLEQVSFTVNTIHLPFDGDVCVTIESSLSHSTLSRMSRANRENVPVSESRLMQLLGESVKAAEANTEGTLTLSFTNGQIFECYDDTSMYESYRMRFGDEEIIV